jgi:hypothetical protein
MTGVKPDAVLAEGQAEIPVLWTVRAPDFPAVDCSDEVLGRYLGPGRGIKLKSFGHDAEGVHFLLTRAGTPLHRDPAYARYSHQLVLRNDGNRLGGLPRYDGPETWHPPLWPGIMYALDTHSPHQGRPDPRMTPPPVVLKAVVAVDRDRLLTPAEAWELVRRLAGVDMASVGYDAALFAAPRWPG